MPSILMYFCVGLLALSWADSVEAKGRFGRILSGGASVAKHYGHHNGSYTLNLDELVVCLRMGQEVDKKSAELESTMNDIDFQSEHLETLGQVIDRSAATLNRYDQTEVNRYNSMVDEYENYRTAFNSKISAYNQAAKQLNIQTSTLNQKCAGKSYYMDDMLKAEDITGLRPW